MRLTFSDLIDRIARIILMRPFYTSAALKPMASAAQPFNMPARFFILEEKLERVKLYYQNAEKPNENMCVIDTGGKRRLQ